MNYEIYLCVFRYMMKLFGKKKYTYNTSFNIIPKKRLLSVRDDVVKDVKKTSHLWL